MPSKAILRESRRSTRVPLKVAIAVESGAERLTCEGETVVISIHVYLTGKRAKARVVYADPENPLRCGVELDQPRYIWVSASEARRLGRDSRRTSRSLRSVAIWEGD